MDRYAAVESLSYFGSFVVIGGLAIWAIVANNRRKAAASRSQAADLEALGRTLALHTDPERATVLVTQVAITSGRLVSAEGSSTAWWIDGGYPMVALEHTPAGSVLAVTQVAVPLPSPAGAILWQWLLDAVEQAANGAGITVSHAGRVFVPSRQVDAYSAVWVPG